MENVVLTVHLILALLLIGIVLLQRSEGGGLGMGGGGGGGAMSSRAAANALSKLTWVLAAGFIVTSMSLTIIARQKADGGSVITNTTTTQPAAPDTPVAPLGDLTPPPAADAPVAPPPAD